MVDESGIDGLTQTTNIYLAHIAEELKQLNENLKKLIEIFEGVKNE